MGKGSGGKRGKHKAARVGLTTGAGSGLAPELAADDGFERVVLTAADGTTGTPQRRVDNLARLERALGAERVQALRLLRDAADAAGIEMGAGCALDMSPRSGSVEGAMEMRIDASRRFDAAWAAVSADCRAAVQRVVLDGWGVHRLAAERGGRIWVVQRRINQELREAADDISAWVDGRYGRARMRWSWDADEVRGEVRQMPEAA